MNKGIIIIITIIVIIIIKTDTHFAPLMLDEDRYSGGSLVLDFKHDIRLSENDLMYLVYHSLVLNWVPKQKN